MSTYILQKDSPDGKKGDEYIYSDIDCCYYKHSEEATKASYMKDTVENNPEWFLPKKD